MVNNLFILDPVKVPFFNPNLFIFFSYFCRKTYFMILLKSASPGFLCRNKKNIYLILGGCCPKVLFLAWGLVLIS